MASRQYVVDVAAYQNTSLATYHSAGAKAVFVKLTEGTGYFNPKATAQIRSAHAHHMYVHAYHFATFGSSVRRARDEAKWFIKRAKVLNISKKRYMALDWETGDGNVVSNGKPISTRAVIAFMNEVKKAGYKVMLYSGASLLRNNIDTRSVVSKFGACLWVASYATMGRIDTPNFGYFPSMDGVAMWQFTDNWHGLGVDGNITLIDLHAENESKPAVKPVKKVPKIVYVPIINNNPNYKVRLLDSEGHYQKYIATNTHWEVWGVKIIKGMKCYKIGTDTQWVPAKFTKIIK
ncbi:GH25 family lysozyme [Lactobacillus helveticus]|uniref:GH25 family lysozyme n=1 Tax=Lactobacillus helveticus TaxID=1587 RepID=UPI0013FD2DB2|nr:GH25 family lysozyme [Lactobacillus helveticus]NHL94369.1 lysin [Lactobacillus helveticus]